MGSISVIIPCYNYGRFLPGAVASALDSQEGADVRVLVIDDASTDGSADVAREIADGDSRVEVAVHAANRGHIATYNDGLEWADGDYCMLLSADDQLTPGALRRAGQFLDAHPSVGFVYGHAQPCRPGKPLPRARARARGGFVWPGPWWVGQLFSLAQNSVPTPAVVMRTSLLKRVGGFDPRLPHTGDLELWLRLAANADVGFIRGADQAYYRLHGRNMHNSYTRVHALRQVRLAYQVVLDRYGERLPDPARLAERMNRELSRQALWAAARAYDRGRVAQTPVEDLVTFAFECWPAAGSLPLRHTLRVRRCLGPRVMPYLQPLIWSAVVDRAEWWWRHRSWRLRGL